MGISDLLFQRARLQKGDKVEGKMAQDMLFLTGFAYPHADGVQDIGANRILWYSAAWYLQETRPMQLISTGEHAYSSTRLHQQIHCYTGHTIWRRVSLNHATWKMTEDVTDRYGEGTMLSEYDTSRCS